MTVASETARNDYVGTGTTGPFAYSFRIFADADLRVTKADADGVETELTLTTDYTVTGAGSYNGGNVTLVTALAVGETLTIRRVLNATQGANLPNQGGYFPEVVEAALDRLTFLIQQLKDESARGLRLPETEAGSELLTILPALADRKGKQLTFDPATGQPVASSPSTAAVSAAMQAVVASATLALARAAMGPWGDAVATATGASTSRSMAARFADVVNVRDHGAVGDGVTDDAAAFRAALNALPAQGGTVYVPAGSYKIGSVVYIPQRSAGTTLGVAIRGDNALLIGTGLSGNTIFETGTGTTSAATNFGQANESAASTHYGLSIRGFTFKDCGTAIRLFNAIQRSDVSDNWFTNCTTAIYCKRCFYLDVVNNHAFLGTSGRLATTPIFHFDETCNQMSIIGNSANGIYVATPKGIGFLFSLGASGLTMINNAAEGCVTGVSVTGQLSAAEMRGWYIENDTTGIDLGSQAKAGLTIDASYFYGNTTAITGTNWTSGEWGSANVIDATGGTVSLSDASNLMEITPAPQYLTDAQAIPSAARFPTGVSIGAAARARHRRVVYDSGTGYAAALVVDAVDATRLPAFAYTGGHAFNGPGSWIPFVSQSNSTGSSTLDTDIDWSDRRMIVLVDINCTYSEGGTERINAIVWSNGSVFRCDAGTAVLTASNNGGKLRLVSTRAAKTSLGWVGQVRHA